MAWPAWAMAHLHSLFFSGAVNVPDGANLLSNTSGTLVGVVLAPVTWAFGPIFATNVALTLAPGLSVWGCFAAVRPLVSWKAGAIPAALVYGYSAAVVSSLEFGHVSVTILVFPPLLFTTLHEIVIRQQHDVRRDGIVLAALLVAQFLVSPEVFVMCLIFTAVGLVAVVLVGWRQVRPRAGHALPAFALGGGITVLVLAYPVWFGLAGPQAVTGVLFSVAPLAGVPLSGLLAPGMYGAPVNAYVRFGGYLGRNGPPPDYLGGGTALATVGAVVVGRRRPLTWLLLFLILVSFVLALGLRVTSGPEWSLHVWLPWHALRHVPLLQEILPDQFAPFLPLFVAFLLAVGLDALFVTSWQRRSWSWPATHRLAAHRRGHRSRGGARAGAGLRDLRPALQGGAGPCAALLPRCRALAPLRHGAAHDSLRRVGLDAADAVAGDRGHAFPPRRCRPQDTGCHRGPGGLGPARFGPADPDRPDRGGCRRTDRDAGSGGGGPPGVAGLARGTGGDRRPQ